MINDKSFNLTSEPWIQVLEIETGQTRLVSLIDIFANAKRYRRLAGDTRSQDLAVMRFLLAIMYTVYSRVDGDSEPYDWIEMDPDTFAVTAPYDEDDTEVNDLLQTWQDLYGAGEFSNVIQRYLNANKNRFDLFGAHPFYQVTTADYDKFVPAKKKIATGTGTVAVKQMNRLISESANSPSIFAPKTGAFKNDLSLSEIVRWLITYQSFTGVTDKTKVETKEKFSTSAGWVYRLNPVYSEGRTLFETLMLNFVISENGACGPQRPVWEYDNISDYVALRKEQTQPNNLADLYTNWSRLIHIEWHDKMLPTFFSAGLPMFNQDNMFIEPMTTWRVDKQADGDARKPATKSTRSIGVAMWRNFGDYVSVEASTDTHEPGIVTWLRMLKNERYIDGKRPIHLVSVALISDGNATSQSPVAETTDYFAINADVIFDEEESKRWPKRIDLEIQATQEVARQYWQFAANVGKIRGLDSRDFASRETARLYDRLNEPFKQWLASLSETDNRDEKVTEWRNRLKFIVKAAVSDFIRKSSLRDIKGIQEGDRLINIFTVRNILAAKVNKLLD